MLNPMIHPCPHLHLSHIMTMPAASVRAIAIAGKGDQRLSSSASNSLFVSLWRVKWRLSVSLSLSLYCHCRACWTATTGSWTRCIRTVKAGHCGVVWVVPLRCDAHGKVIAISKRKSCRAGLRVHSDRAALLLPARSHSAVGLSLSSSIYTLAHGGLTFTSVPFTTFIHKQGPRTLQSWTLILPKYAYPS